MVDKLEEVFHSSIGKLHNKEVGKMNVRLSFKDSSRIA